MHVYYVERIFSRPEPLRRIGLLAATHHERMDGSGYHRGVGGTMLSAPARVLAAADAYQRHDRSRARTAAALTEAEAARQLRHDVGEGGSTPPRPTPCSPPPGTGASRTRAGGPAGLTARESEVLGLLARRAAQQGDRPRAAGSARRPWATTSSTSTPSSACRTGPRAAMVAMQYGLVAPAHSAE